MSAQKTFWTSAAIMNYPRLRWFLFKITLCKDSSISLCQQSCLLPFCRDRHSWRDTIWRWDYCVQSSSVILGGYIPRPRCQKPQVIPDPIYTMVCSVYICPW
jgi:hypothetical protein